MKRILTAICLAVFFFGYADAQITVSIPDTTVTQAQMTSSGNTVVVPINVTNFNGIGAISLVVTFDPNKVTFDNIVNGPGHGNFSYSSSGDSIYISWFDFNPLNLGNGELLGLSFKNVQGTSPLTFVTSISEIADTGTNVQNINYSNGAITLPAAAPLPATVGGNVWYDANGDGLKDNGEKGVQWVTVDLFKCSGMWLRYALTDSAGNFSFDSLAPGSYTVRFTLIDGNKNYKFTTKGVGNDVTINSSAGQTNDSTGYTDCFDVTSGQVYLSANAGLVNKTSVTPPPSSPASVGDFVWEDSDVNDGIQRVGDPGIPNVTVRLYCCCGDFVDSTVTDSQGHYLFSNLSAGDYRIQFVLPPDYVFVAQHMGSDTTVDSDADTVTGMTSCFTLTAGENLTTIDAGMHKLVSGSGKPLVYIEKNDNLVMAPDSGGTTTYKLTFGNYGTADLYNTTITDTLPAGMSFVSSTFGGETYSGSNIFSYSFGTLTVNAENSVDVTVKITASENQYSNSAYIAGVDYYGNKVIAHGTDVDLADTTSNSENGGVESRGDMATLLLQRQLKIKYGMTTPILKNKGARGITAAYGLSDLIPVFGPYNSKAAEATPFDILGISNAVSSYAVNYTVSTSGVNLRVGGVFSTITAAPYIYDHLKAVCDRLAGYQIDGIKLVNINGYQFYGAELQKASANLSDYAISFSVYETPTGFQVENKWTYEEYKSPSGASSIYNFQVWASSYDAAAQIVTGIISRFKSYGSVSYLNTQQSAPDVFIKTADYTHDGNIHLTVVNNTQAAKSVNINTAFRASQGDDQVQTNANYTVQPGVSEVVINTGIISDANLYMSQAGGFNDEVYVSGGAYSYITGPSSTVSTFTTNTYPQQQLSNYPEGSLVLSGGAYASGQLADWTTVVRSLNAESSPLDLSKYGSIRFDASGTGTIEVIFNMANTQNYNYYAYRVNLTPDTRTYTIDFSQFKEIYGSQSPFDAQGMEDVGFIINTSDNPGMTNYSFEVKNIAFIPTNVTDVSSQTSVPKEFALQQNYPNPFNPSTVIQFSVPKLERLQLNVYNILGQKVATLLNGELAPGMHTVTFDASKLSSGIYFYQLIGNGVNITRKMILTK